ncbi:hypothetical protein B8X00_12205 [Acetobacter fabarum]|uniref:Uncharacterized protein n=1 Tax=Acetobacter fabarum TaxID=483199 RepID=A0A269XUL5_9PROT|nr:hypothetical protein [Acetobacter fabarum]PAK76964.1 hypothetical protein B8X00_12205 [Acetobacter fabarum]
MKQQMKPWQVRPIDPAVMRSLNHFSRGRRNAVRGVVGAVRQGTLDSKKIDSIRANHTEADMIAAATMLEAPNGLRKREIVGLVQSDIPPFHKLKAYAGPLEAAYACGFINAWKDQALLAIQAINRLSRLTEVPVAAAISELREFAETWGASSYLASKIVFADQFFDINEKEQKELATVIQMTGHSDDQTLHYTTLENIDAKFSIFIVAQRRANVFNDYVEGDFRRFYSLSDLVSTPVSNEDCGPFLLRAVCSSLIDTVRALWSIVNLKGRLPSVYAAIESNLDANIFDLLISCHDEVAALTEPKLLSVTESTHDSSSEDGHSLLLWRRSAAFLEFPSLCRYRNDIDCVVGYRLISPLLSEPPTWTGKKFNNFDTLKKPNGRFELSTHDSEDVSLDTFYRTYLFLRFIQDPMNLSLLSSEDVLQIFDSTMRLETLLLEPELKTMHLNASDEARALISVLALSLYRNKSSDPDIDFDFRESLVEFIIANFEGSIPKFIDNLAPSSSEVAHYILTSLDEVTLQKMYQIVKSPVEAENARREILTSIGRRLGKIEYIVEAQAIETRAKVAKLKSYFDASRMFVDSIAMKKWLSSNPSSCTELYKALLPTLSTHVSSPDSALTGTRNVKESDIVEFPDKDIYLVERIATEAFREFCVNNEFGIESYLGRRIRHNTLHGVMTQSVDTVLQMSEFNPIIKGTPFGEALKIWQHSFNVFIERMRKEFLQFRNDARPNALFNSEIDPSDTVTKRNLRQLLNTLNVSAPEMLDELIVTFCWGQIGPQLEAASSYIRVKMMQQMTQQLDQALQRFNGPEELKVKSALESVITSVFAQVASWFQAPQTGFVPASIVEICNIVDLEAGRQSTPTKVVGDRQNVKYFGLSVHRLYDCLAVLLGNAFKHGRPDSDVTVKVTTAPVQTTKLHALDVAVRSSLPIEGAKECIERMQAALGVSETGRDMVSEGFSGIKKVKFITRLNEGKSTVEVGVDGNDIEVRFRLKAEVVDEENGY